MERERKDGKSREEAHQKAQGRPLTKALFPRAKSTHQPLRKNRVGEMRGVRSVQNTRLWNVRKLSGGRTKGHEGTKQRDWRQYPRSMRGGAKKVRELAGEPAPATVLKFLIGYVQHSQQSNH